MGQSPDVPPGQLPVPPTIVPAKTGTLPVIPTITSAPDPNSPNGLNIGCGNQGEESCGPNGGDIAAGVVGLGFVGLGYLLPEIPGTIGVLGLVTGYAASKVPVDPNQAFPIYAIPNKEWLTYFQR